MLDLRATSSTGSTTLAAIATILLGGDGQTTAGVPVTGGATLAGWGGITAVADTIKEIQMQSLDQLDDINTEDFLPGASSLLLAFHFWENLPYKSAARIIKMAQNTGAGVNMAYTLDNYAGGSVTQNKKYGTPSGNWVGSTTSGGLTAVTWKQTALNPGTTPPAGKYAIQGCWVNAIGTSFTALIRFRHSDFGTFAPGFPVQDQTNSAAARGNIPGDTIFLNQGYQFTHLSEVLGVPSEPVFTVGPNGTGLQLELASITADTPIVTLNLAKVG